MKKNMFVWTFNDLKMGFLFLLITWIRCFNQSKHGITHFSFNHHQAKTGIVRKQARWSISGTRIGRACSERLLQSQSRQKLGERLYPTCSEQISLLVFSHWEMQSGRLLGSGRWSSNQQVFLKLRTCDYSWDCQAATWEQGAHKD